MKRFIGLVVVFIILSCVGISYANPPDFVPPGHRWDHNWKNNFNVTNKVFVQQQQQQNNKQSLSNEINSPVTVKTENKNMTWPNIPVTLPGEPLPYFGEPNYLPLKDNPWFARVKWQEEYFVNYPAHGKADFYFVTTKTKTTAVYPVNGIKTVPEFTQPMTYLGDAVCQSKDSDSNAQSIWGECAPGMIERGTRIAVLVDATMVDGIVNKKLAGGVSGVFMSIFGNLFTAGAGPSIGGSEDVTRPYKHITTTWRCYATE